MAETKAFDLSFDGRSAQTLELSELQLVALTLTTDVIEDDWATEDFDVMVAAARSMPGQR